jgi:fructokinase
VSLILIASPERIVFGGGVFNRTCLYDKIRAKTQDLLKGYIQHEAITTREGIEKYICASHWGNNAGIVGVAFLAFKAS